MVPWAPHTVVPTCGSRESAVVPTSGSHGSTVGPTCGTHIVGSYGAHGGAHMLDQSEPFTRDPTAEIFQPTWRNVGAEIPPLVCSIIMGSVIAHYAACKYVRRFNPSTIYIKRVGFAEVLGCFLWICCS